MGKWYGRKDSKLLQKNVYHHGKLEKPKLKLQNIKNALFIIDEVDTGDKRHAYIQYYKRVVFWI